MKSTFAATLAGCAIMLASAWAAQPTDAAKGEIAHLFSRLETSGCEFSRNGTWYQSQAAAAHLRKKYQYLLDKGMLATAEDFIAKAASESSASGKPYQVRCNAAAPVASSEWFKAELASLRKSAK
jgi:hypothetical protein